MSVGNNVSEQKMSVTNKARDGPITVFICSHHLFVTVIKPEFQFYLWYSFTSNSASCEPILKFLGVLESSGLFLFDFFYSRNL